MRTLFIEQAENRIGLKGIFSKVSQRGNKIIINVNLNTFKTKVKVVKKIVSVLSREKCKQIALTPRLKEDKDFLNLLYSYNINICSSNWIFKEFINEVVEQVLKGKQKEECEIHICVNYLDSKVEELINKFAKEFKTTNIVTNHIGKFRKIEDRLYQEEGILINVSNNRRKSLQKAELILNIDFPNEILNQFVINDNSTIIDWESCIKIKKKRFNGRIIKDINFTLSEEENEILNFVKENGLEDFDIRDICQAIEVVPKGTVDVFV